jgi:hypothetical protein
MRRSSAPRRILSPIAPLRPSITGPIARGAESNVSLPIYVCLNHPRLSFGLSPPSMTQFVRVLFAYPAHTALHGPVLRSLLESPRYELAPRFRVAQTISKVPRARTIHLLSSITILCSPPSRLSSPARPHRSFQDTGKRGSALLIWPCCAGDLPIDALPAHSRRFGRAYFQQGRLEASARRSAMIGHLCLPHDRFAPVRDRTGRRLAGCSEARAPLSTCGGATCTFAACKLRRAVW